MEPTREELEDVLRSARPMPRTEFVRGLEESLLRSLETPRLRPRPARLRPGHGVPDARVRAAIAGIALALIIAGAPSVRVGAPKTLRRR
jgi:hypothetical protein